MASALFQSPVLRFAHGPKARCVMYSSRPSLPLNDPGSLFKTHSCFRKGSHSKHGTFPLTFAHGPKARSCGTRWVSFLRFAHVPNLASRVAIHNAQYFCTRPQPRFARRNSQRSIRLHTSPKRVSLAICCMVSVIHTRRGLRSPLKVHG